ncbi:hypothetical protein ABIA33_006858 [Streptacidiphilus sp. MAP12-16]
MGLTRRDWAPPELVTYTVQLRPEDVLGLLLADLAGG